MNFKVGDVVKRPNGKMVYEIISITKYRFRTFYKIHNKINDKRYDVASLKSYIKWDYIKPIQKLRKWDLTKDF